MWITLAFVVGFAVLLIWQRSRLNKSTQRFDPDSEYRGPSSRDRPGKRPENGSAP